MKNKYSETILAAKEILKNDSTSKYANLAIGRSYDELGKTDSASIYFDKLLKLDKDSSYFSGWGHAYRGYMLLLKGEKQRGFFELDLSMQLHPTNNLIIFIERQRKKYGEKNIINEGENLYTKIEGKNIDYYLFFNTADKGSILTEYIAAHEKAYNSLNTVFHAVLPNKMEFRVWVDKEKAKKMLHKEPGYTIAKKCKSYVLLNQTTGHEMVHTLSYWAWGKAPQKISRFINEGLAVAFDQTNRDRFLVAKDALKGSRYKDVLEIWKAEDTVAPEILYPVGGAFMSYVYQHTEAEQFKRVIKNQTMENMKEVLGEKQFDELIKDFDALVFK